MAEIFVSGTEGLEGRVHSVRGPVVDVRFNNAERLPAVYDVIMTQTIDKQKVVLQVAEHLGGKDVRCISLTETLNLQLSAKVVCTGSPIKVPVGDELYGRIINVFGEPVDQMGPLDSKEFRVIRVPPVLDPFNTKDKFGEVLEILETGMKYIDLLYPLVKGSKTGILGGAGCGKSVVILELINKN